MDRTVALFAGAALLRVLVGWQPHSGQDNHHGQTAAYGGDYEAQRHWMELTIGLPIGEWYWYDLNYWGLDYPVLSAYLSWICGHLSVWLVGPETMMLDTSRGWEDPLHKSFMRGTVLLTDLVVYGSAVYAWSKPQTQTTKRRIKVWNFLFATLQPALVLIDHGHFQYNTTALGFSLWCFYFLQRQQSWNDYILGSVCFCLALSFKQMTLYYAPVVFCYLLGRCFQRGRIGTAIYRILLLGTTVITCFVALWWPVVVYGPSDTTHWERLRHVLRRIFPLERGLFEGKVSNLWCALSVKPVRIRERVDKQYQPVLALATTAALIVPSCFALFRCGVRRSSVAESRRLLLWGTLGSALAFFLASFQVHEKSILLALSPLSLLYDADPSFCVWFSVVAVWTLWPLVVIDRLQTAYVCLMVIFVCANGIREELKVEGDGRRGFFETWKLFRWIPNASYATMLVLHLVEAILPNPPEHLPDLYPVVWSVAGCGFFCFAWVVSCWHLFRCPPKPNRKPKVS